VTPISTVGWMRRRGNQVNARGEKRKGTRGV